MNSLNKKIVLIVVAIVLVVMFLYAAMTSDSTVDQPLLVNDVPTDVSVSSATVTNIDLDPLAYDGSAIIEADIPTGNSIRIEVPARINLCAAADNIVSLNELALGQQIEVSGSKTTAGAIVPCDSADHYLGIVSGDAADVSQTGADVGSL